jgi:hypothetical protein
MSLTARQQQILEWIDQGNNADVLNVDFEEFLHLKLGGISLKTAMKDVRHLYAEGWLRRSAMATGMPFAGGAKWVRSYVSKNKVFGVSR